MFSYFVENASNALLIILRWFLRLFLLGLYEQFIKGFRVLNLASNTPVIQQNIRCLDVLDV